MAIESFRYLDPEEKVSLYLEHVYDTFHAPVGSIIGYEPAWIDIITAATIGDYSDPNGYMEIGVRTPEFQGFFRVDDNNTWGLDNGQRRLLGEYSERRRTLTPAPSIDGQLYIMAVVINEASRAA